MTITLFGLCSVCVCLFASDYQLTESCWNFIVQNALLFVAQTTLTLYQFAHPINQAET